MGAGEAQIREAPKAPGFTGLSSCTRHVHVSKAGIRWMREIALRRIDVNSPLLLRPPSTFARNAGGSPGNSSLPSTFDWEEIVVAVVVPRATQRVS